MMTFSFRPARTIGLAFDRGVGENLGGLLERRGRQERVGSQRSLGDAKQQRLAHGRLLAFCR